MKFSPQGSIYLAERDSTTLLPGVFWTPGCADDLSVALSVDKWEHTESCSGNHSVDATGIKKQSAALNMTLTDFKDKNLELGLNGVTTARAGSTTAVTNEALPTAIVVGDVYYLGQLTGSPKTGITALSIVDSTGSPITLVLNTDYTADLNSGRITFLTAIGIQPYKANYTHQVDKQVTMFTAGTKEYWMRFEAKNLQNSSKLSMVDLYRVRFDPTSKFDLLADELAALPLSGSVLIDTNKAVGGALGQFGRITIPV